MNNRDKVMYHCGYMQVLSDVIDKLHENDPFREVLDRMCDETEREKK